ncbi:VanW family protein [Candidatus Daviesbacteria bacterium]|nr:VanW family protein [Candidatus Daviesbacteria bacterium]
MISKVVQTSALISILGFNQVLATPANEHLLAEQEISLAIRHEVPFVNEVFKDNILLNLAYLEGIVSDPKNVNWEQVRKPSNYEFILNPGESFAFHKDILPEYKEKRVVKTTNTYFNAQDGYKFSGYLYGDGVCHFASLIRWVAEEAGLEVLAPTNHDFAQIPQIDQKDGVSIFYNPGAELANAKQNLYVTNNKQKLVKFVFLYQGDNLAVSVVEIN